MEILKKRLRTNQYKGRALTQITLDDDFNVPDVRPDIDKIIEETGDLKISEVHVMDGKVGIRGKLEFGVLYVSNYDQRPIHHMDGAIDFEETVNMDQVAEGDEVKVDWDMEDLRTSLINSRKLSVRSIISLSLTASCIYEIEDVYKRQPILLMRIEDEMQNYSRKRSMRRKIWIQRCERKPQLRQ